MKIWLVVSLLLVILYHVTAQGTAKAQGTVPAQGRTSRINNMNYLRELMMSRMRGQQGTQWPQRKPFVPRPRFMPANLGNLLAGAYVADNMDAFDDFGMFDNF